jgi:hypothetical protein
MSEYVGERRFGDYTAAVYRGWLEEPLSSEDFDVGVEVLVTHEPTGEDQIITVTGVFLENEPVIQLFTKSGDEYFLNDAALVAIAHSLGSCTMEVTEWPSAVGVDTDKGKI